MSGAHHYWIGNCLSTNDAALTKVHQSQHTGNGENFAVRFLNDELLQQQFQLPIEEQKKVLAAFIKDCQHLVALSRHVNVVQHVGIIHDERERPGLLMEMMNMSLTVYLYGDNRAQQPVSLPIQIGLSHDIAQALAFLHQNGIVHQNLSANSVFLRFDDQLPTPLAKVGDFGMTEFSQSIGRFTEAESPRVNIVAFGYLMTQIMTKQQATDVQQINTIISHLDNPLVCTIQRCIQGTDEDYPSADFLAMSIAKQTIAYTCKRVQEQEATIQDLQVQSFQMQSKELESAGVPLQRSCDAVMDRTHNTIYLRQGRDRKLFAFSLNDNNWKHLTDCKLLQCTLAFFEGKLWAVGGAETDESPRSNKVYKLVEGTKSTWETAQKPLKTARGRSTALACEFNNSEFLIVAGGERLRRDDNPSSGFESLSDVEVFKEQEWHLASKLPGALCCASGTVVKDTVCLLGGWSERNVELLAVYTCYLGDLISSVPFIQIWSEVRISRCPVALTTCTTFQNNLLLIGGTAPNDPRKTPDDAIRAYNKHTNDWDIIGHLQAPRYLCYAQALCKCRFLIVGGCKDSSITTDDTHIYELK